MLGYKSAFVAIFLITLSGCQAAPKQGAFNTSLNSGSISRSVSELNPELPSNQLANDDAYGQLIVTVESEDVITELRAIAEMTAAIQEVYFLKSNNSFQSLVYMIQFKRNINPIPYHGFIENYDGVLGVEFDGIIGLADTSNFLPAEH